MTWILPFVSRGSSLAVRMNFLWCSGNVYVMDNHRAALWCWLAKISVDEKYDVVHVDAHNDTRRLDLSRWPVGFRSEIEGAVEAYLDFKLPGDDCPAVVWDNYLSLFCEAYAERIADLWMFTHGEGDWPNRMYESVLPHKFLEEFGAVTEDPANKLIVNIDLDYFFCRGADGKVQRMFSRHVEGEFFTLLKKAQDSGKISVLSICLSPECSGGWESAEELCEELMSALGLDFELPAKRGQVGLPRIPQTGSQDTVLTVW